MRSNRQRLTQRQAERIQRLLPAGKPRWVRIYDNEGESLDRYTVVFTGRRAGGRHCLAMSEHPTWPQGGVCIHDSLPRSVDAYDAARRQYIWPPAVGRRHPWLGRRIRFEDLPAACQRVVLEDYCDLWDIPLPAAAGTSEDSGEGG